MDAVLLARLQFALTVGFHYLFPPLTIGLSWLIVWLEWKHFKTGLDLWRRAARFWIKLFAISFAIGVATGITMEFQFGTNWANYSRYVGDIFGAPLAAEGVLAFFLESTFLGVVLFGEKRVSRRFYWFSTLMVAFGSTLSAFWIIVANSWQQTPAGFAITNGHAELTDFMAALFNPSTLPRYEHTVVAALLTGAFFMMGLSAWLLLKNRHTDVARSSLKLALIVAAVAAIAQLGTGHIHAVQVAHTQPAKLAAFEGLWETQSNAPLLLFGWPDPQNERTDFAIGLPGALSFGVGFDTNTKVQGLKDFKPEDRPPLPLTFASFHLMVGLGMFFIAFSLLGLLLLVKDKLYENKLFLRLAVLAVPLPFLANELGWIAAEVGRQPWIVYGLLRTKDAASPSVPAAQILISIIGFGLIYALLFGVWIFLLKRKLDAGPEEAPSAVTKEV